jgi:O-antigen/teichoic acid export membrane protein
MFRFFRDKEIIDTIFVSGGVVLGSFFSYLLQFLLGRVLSVEDYGAFNALLSLSLIFGVPAILFGAPLIKVVSELYANERKDILSKMFVSLIIFGLIFGSTFALGIYLLRSQISNYLQINNTTAVWVFGLGVLFSFATPIFASYLQGIMRYRVFVLLTVVTSFLRFILIFFFGWKGFGLTGLFVGSFLSLLLGVLIGIVLLREFISFSSSEGLTQYYKKILKLGYFSIILFFGLNFLNNLDVVMVKNLFDPTLAGYYSATVTVGKILLFGAGSVTVVMFPKISALYAKKENYRAVFKKMFLLQLFIVALGITFYTFMSKYIVNILFGSKFDSAVTYLPLFSVFIGMYVIVNFLLMYLLAVEKTSSMYVLIPVVALQYSLISYYHQNLYQVIYANIIASSVALCLLFLHSLKLPK